MPCFLELRSTLSAAVLGMLMPVSLPVPAVPSTKACGLLLETPRWRQEGSATAVCDAIGAVCGVVFTMHAMSRLMIIDNTLFRILSASVLTAPWLELPLVFESVGRDACYLARHREGK
ncbi:hypothetical protein BC826DRAFT_264612 [Russula brevipes]|nr:hypothetical protein BC826DRAFT_264612 [Russula brevipes]